MVCGMYSVRGVFVVCSARERVSRLQESPSVVGGAPGTAEVTAELKVLAGSGRGLQNGGAQGILGGGIG